MGSLIDGKWEKSPLIKTDKNGKFIRQDSLFRDWIKKEDDQFKPEKDRYHLYISHACPWASRTVIFRKLKELEDIISLSTVNPLMLDNGWEFGPKNSESSDPLYQSRYLYEIYLKADPNYTGKVTVPVLWDKKSETIVNNESSEIIRMLNSEFNEFTNNKNDFYPKHLHQQINEINDFVYHNINNGVYKCGFASSQSAYENAFDNLFSALDKLEEKLSKQRYLVNNELTEADWRLFTTLVRFDVVYVGHFKCNLRRIEDYPHLSNYLRDLYQTPGIAETVNLKHIKEHYYRSHTQINPSGIVPKGPEINFETPHNRGKKLF